MVLETDPVYYAIQVVSENGYTVIKNEFVSLLIIIFVGVGALIGYLIGKRKK